MLNISKRVEYFSAEENRSRSVDFTVQTVHVRLLSEWATDKLGITSDERVAYIRKNIANICRSNAVEAMISEIQKDFLRAHVDVEDEELLSASREASEKAHSMVNPFPGEHQL